MLIEIVPCLRDNYAYLVLADNASDCIVVDPSEAAPVSAALRAHGLRLTGILNTHHHYDHVGGNTELVKAHPGIDVWGHTSDRGRIPEQTMFVNDGDEFEVASLRFRVMHIPGHTLGAVAYCAADVVFTGDTLFGAGCGRLFEGTPADMFASLNQKLASLPDSTRVFCGHEYTENNLRFAAHLEPDNPDISSRRARVATVRASGQPSLPSTLAEERLTNPFMRCSSPELAQSLGLAQGTDPISVLAATRKAKDAF